MSYQITGSIYKVKETQIFQSKKEGGNDFQKRAFVLEVRGKYDQLIELEFVQDNCNKLDGYAIGQEVEVEFDIKGREWDGDKGLCYFNTLNAWAIKSVGGPHPAPPEFSQKSTPSKDAELPKQDPPTLKEAIESEDDIPF